jgi:serine/threonine-protein kinase
VLEGEGFKVRTHGVESSKKPGVVVTQDPAARTEVDKGSGVDLGVSSGPGQQLVPDVANLPAKQAVEALNTAGFKVTQDLQPSSTVTKGIAIRTSPPKDKLIPKGSDVRLLVSSGPPQVQVPGVVGQDKDVARATLGDAGFKVTTQLLTSTVTKGKVISQSPTAGTTVDKGARVTIVVSKGPQMVAVPDEVTKTKADAVTDLRAAGFKVKVVEQESTLTAGTVISQSPTAGTKAVKGSSVTIVVAKAPAGTGGAGPGSTTTTPAPPPGTGTTTNP